MADLFALGTGASSGVGLSIAKEFATRGVTWCSVLRVSVSPMPQLQYAEGVR